jgi:hypothetical protein
MKRKLKDSVKYKTRFYTINECCALLFQKLIPYLMIKYWLDECRGNSSWLRINSHVYNFKLKLSKHYERYFMLLHKFYRNNNAAAFIYYFNTQTGTLVFYQNYAKFSLKLLLNYEDRFCFTSQTFWNSENVNFKFRICINLSWFALFVISIFIEWDRAKIT